MRIAAASAAALLLGSLSHPAGAQRKNVIKRSERLFGHAAHAEKVAAAGKDALGCFGACHKANAEGKFIDGGSAKREHDRCDSCHTFTFTRSFVQGEGGRVCLSCHKKPSGFRVSEGPVHEIEGPTHATIYSHRRHVMPGAATGKQCEGCHGKFGDKAPRTGGALDAGHPFCAGCHERGAEPLMKQCDGCHVGKSHPRYETPVVAKSASSRYAVSGAFSHRRHARQDRVGKDGRECLTCHDNLAKARGDADVPRPTMQGCYEDCHDGEEAFSATGTECSRCHPAQSGAGAGKKPEVRRFRHELHAAQGLAVKDCKSCHALKNDFSVRPATSGKGHQPCAQSGCHADEFFARKPTICTVCHERFEPFARPRAMVRRRKESEFGGDLSHVSHTKKVGDGGKNAACKACHGDVYRGGEVPGGGHETCAPCHGTTAEPAMRNCGGCHRLGETRAALAGGASKWSVAARFTHEVHGADPRRGGGETACVTCHESISKATKIAEIANPTMPSCDGCHDGEISFKTTGFECYRCHGDQKQ